MAGTADAVLEHTMSSLAWSLVELNGRPLGEIRMDAMLFGRHGVPILLVSGDDKTCREAEAEIPGVATYETKRGLARQGTLLKAPERVYQEIPAAVEKALTGVANVSPITLPGPYEMSLRYKDIALADKHRCDGVFAKRVSPNEIVIEGIDFIEVFNRM